MGVQLAWVGGTIDEADKGGLAGQDTSKKGGRERGVSAADKDLDVGSPVDAVVRACREGAAAWRDGGWRARRRAGRWVSPGLGVGS